MARPRKTPRDSDEPNLFTTVSQARQENRPSPDTTSPNYVTPMRRVPIDYMVRRGKVDIPEIFPFRNYRYAKELDTLREQYGFELLGEVLSAPLSEDYTPLKSFLKNNAAVIQQRYSSYSNTPVKYLPEDITNRMNLATMAHAFIRQYIDALRQDIDGEITGSPAAKELDMAYRLLWKLYLDEEDVTDAPTDTDQLSYTYTQLAQEMGFPKERVRAILQKYSADMFSVLDQDHLRYTLNSRMVKRLKDVELKKMGVVPFSEFQDKVGKAGPKTSLFLMEYAGKVIFDRCPRLEPFLIPEGYITDVNFSMQKLLRAFRDAPLPIGEAALKQRIKEVTSSPEVGSTLEAIVKKADCFYVRRTSPAETTYGLKWEYLDKILSQVMLILFDSGKPLFLDEIVVKYRRLSLEHGLSQPEITEKYLRTCPALSTAFAGGAWGLKIWLENEEGIPQAASSIASSGRPSTSFASTQAVANALSGSMAHGFAEEKVLPSAAVPSPFVAAVAGMRTAVQASLSSTGKGRPAKTLPQGGDMLRMIAECIHKKGGRAKLTEIKTYIHEMSGTTVQVSQVKGYIDVAPEIFKAQAAKSRNAFFILRRPVDSIDFSKYKDTVVKA